MRRQEKDLVLDFLTFVVAVLGCLILNVLGNFLRSPEVKEKVFREDFGFSIFSFGILYLLLLDIKYLLSFKFSFPNWSHHILWILTIISGAFLLAYFTDKGAFFDTEIFFERSFAVLFFALFPAVLFRSIIGVVILFWPLKEPRISVAK